MIAITTKSKIPTKDFIYNPDDEEKAEDKRKLKWAQVLAEIESESGRIKEPTKSQGTAKIPLTPLIGQKPKPKGGQLRIVPNSMKDLS